MSTVPEAIAARECGLELVGLSTVTAVEGAPSGIDPSEVVAVAERTAARCGPLLRDLLVRGVRRAGSGTRDLAGERVVEQVGEGELGGSEQR